jgi:hypothetical protein
MTNEHQIILDKRSILRIHGVTALIASAAIVFYLFFQVNKGGPFRDINPFGVDPYDAVGSFAFQGALLVGILTYARALRLWELPALANRARLILRGNLVVLFAIWVTLIADAIAEVLIPIPPSFWGNVLLVELGLIVLLTLVCTVALWVVFGRIQIAAPPPDLTPADGIDDLWTLVRVPVVKAGARLPQGLVTWVAGFNSDRLFARLPWINPRLHPWRFAWALGLLVGAGLLLAQLQEGLPPSLRTGLIVIGIFISAELAAILIGFAIFGGYLGLRPPVRAPFSSLD